MSGVTEMIIYAQKHDQSHWRTVPKKMGAVHFKSMKISQLFHKIKTSNKELYKTVMCICAHSKLKRLIRLMLQFQSFLK